MQAEWETFKAQACKKLVDLEERRIEEQMEGPTKVEDVCMGDVLLFGSTQKLPFAHLSNFTATKEPFAYKGDLWSSSEHAYQAHLCLEPGELEKMSFGSMLSDMEKGAVAIDGSTAPKTMRFWGPKVQKNGVKRGMVGILAKKAVKEKTAKLLKLRLKPKPDFSTANVSSLFLDILKAKYEADAELRDVLVKGTAGKYLLEFERGAQREGKKAKELNKPTRISRWGGMITKEGLWGINLQGELQMLMREWLLRRSAEN